MYCEGNSLTINLSFDMPKGYETANGTFDPTVNTLFINKEMLQSQPEYEQMFYLFHELRHALQYLHPESFDGLIARSRLYVIQYDGTCYKLVDGEWKECKKKSAFRNRNAGIKISPKTEVFGEFLLFFDSTVVFGLVRCGFFLFFGMFFILFLCPLFSGFYAL